MTSETVKRVRPRKWRAREKVLLQRRAKEHAEAVRTVAELLRRWRRVIL
jgi:hypothetical protein